MRRPRALMPPRLPSADGVAREFQMQCSGAPGNTELPCHGSRAPAASWTPPELRVVFLRAPVAASLKSPFRLLGPPGF
eukprot:6239189-Alexandrium_andersonii.AAC.1